MKEILGFAVLTGPLWLILILLIAAIWSARKFATHLKGRGMQIAGGVGIFLSIFLVPFGDEIAGSIYFDHLCATESGVKVHQTVELPEEYWNANGQAKFFNEKNGNFLFSKEYPIVLKIEKNHSIFHIDRLVTTLWSHSKEKMLAEKISYMYWGGWLSRNLSLSNTAKSCGNGVKDQAKFIYQVFKKTSPL